MGTYIGPKLFTTNSNTLMYNTCSFQLEGSAYNVIYKLQCISTLQLNCLFTQCNVPRAACTASGLISHLNCLNSHIACQEDSYLNCYQNRLVYYGNSS